MRLTPAIYFREVPPELDRLVGRSLGEVRSELYSTNEFTFAVAVILSAQATDKKVNEVTPALFKAADTPEKMLKLGEAGLKKHIKVISFFNNKARNIIGLARALRGGAALPRTREKLMKLPGIGQKTANVIMNVLWNAPMIGVDTHLLRLSHRFGWAGAADNTPEKVEKKLLKLIPKKYHETVNHVMVLHGRYVCKALRPKCAECPVAKWCNAPDRVI
ncbi:MAG: endonuclease III [Alphaproteobacteria bacterium]|nr:endonuclease III [Alphaproteobacteria bacterium]MCL2757695.1 endonuclease III [Alphaproteobacteria bacterium]